MQTTWKKVYAALHLGAEHPVPDCLPCVFRYLELHWFLCFACNDRDAVADTVSNKKVDDFQSEQVAATQFAINREIKQGQVPEVSGEFKPRSDCPDLLGKQGALLADAPALVPGRTGMMNDWELDIGHFRLPRSIPPTPNINTVLTGQVYRSGSGVRVLGD